MSVRKIMVGLIAAAALVTMSGCSGQSGATAADVDGQVLTQSWVDQATAATNDVVAHSQIAQGQPVDLSNVDAVGFVVQNAIAEKVLTAALAKYGVTITDEQRESALSQSGVTQGSVDYDLWANPATRECVRASLDISLANAAISSGAVAGDQLLAAIADVPVTVNPRYGAWVWDPSSQGQMGVTSRLTAAPSGLLAELQKFTIN